MVAVDEKVRNGVIFWGERVIAFFKTLFGFFFFVFGFFFIYRVTG